MIWLLTMCLLTAIFTVGLTGRYKDEIIELKQQLMDKDKEWQEQMYELMTKHAEQIDALKARIKNGRS
jgi:hypothetical protein